MGRGGREGGGGEGGTASRTPRHPAHAAPPVPSLQVSAILNPVVLTVEALPRLAAADPTFAQYVDAGFGSVDGAQQAILRDFFAHGFDGSGADNFFDAGSCIDGRLTSAWNWTQKIDKKPFAKIFLVAGFFSFDGKEWAE